MQVMVQAFGKVNLYLDVLHKRPDGFHEVQMIMQGVRLSDQVKIKEAEVMSLHTKHPHVPENHKNLAWQAAQLLIERYHLPNVHINIKKQIPVSAGMAGGSTDAAAVLAGMNVLFDLNLSNKELENLGAELGSDVPFCISGATAAATGRGEILENLPLLPKVHIVMLPFNFGVSTAKVYNSYLPTKDKKSSFEVIKKACQSQDPAKVLSHLFNDLEKTAFSLYPKIRNTYYEMFEYGAKNVIMSGSGPTLLAAFLSEEEAWSFYKKLSAVYKNVVLTSTVGKEDLNRKINIIN